MRRRIVSRTKIHRRQQLFHRNIFNARSITLPPFFYSCLHPALSVTFGRNVIKGECLCVAMIFGSVKTTQVSNRIPSREQNRGKKFKRKLEYIYIRIHHAELTTITRSVKFVAEKKEKRNRRKSAAQEFVYCMENQTNRSKMCIVVNL